MQLNRVILIMLIVPLAVFVGCEHTPYTPRSPEAIVAYLNTTYEGEFALIDSKSSESYNSSHFEVSMTCSLFPGKVVYVLESWSYSLVYGDQMTEYLEFEVSAFFSDNRVFICPDAPCYSYKNPASLQKFIGDHLRDGHIFVVKEAQYSYSLPLFEELLYFYLTANQKHFFQKYIFLKRSILIQ